MEPVDIEQHRTGLGGGDTQAMASFSHYYIFSEVERVRAPVRLDRQRGYGESRRSELLALLPAAWPNAPFIERAPCQLPGLRKLQPRSVAPR